MREYFKCIGIINRNNYTSILEDPHVVLQTSNRKFAFSSSNYVWLVLTIECIELLYHQTYKHKNIICFYVVFSRYFNFFREIKEYYVNCFKITISKKEVKNLLMLIFTFNIG